jgi:hypothetical protein
MSVHEIERDGLHVDERIFMTFDGYKSAMCDIPADHLIRWEELA